jgi:hypothetical protein
MLTIRQNSLPRTGTQIGGGQGEVQVRLVALYLSAQTVTFPLLPRIGLRIGSAQRIGTAPCGFPQCKGLRREPARKAFEAGELSYVSWAGTFDAGVSILRSRLRKRLDMSMVIDQRNHAISMV